MQQPSPVLVLVNEGKAENSSHVVTERVNYN